jgi:hypothetical protein
VIAIAGEYSATHKCLPGILMISVADRRRRDRSIFASASGPVEHRFAEAIAGIAHDHTFD